MEYYFSKQMMEQMEAQMEGLFVESGFSFQTCFEFLFRGDVNACIEYIVTCLKNGTTLSIVTYKEILLCVLILGIIGSIFQLFADSFESKQISKISQGLFLCLASVLLLGIYEQGYEICGSFLEKQGDFLKILLPAFCITLTVGSGAATGYSYYELTLLVLSYMQYFLQLVFFPLIRLYVVFSLLNSFEKQGRFKQIQKLCARIIEWGSRVGLYVGVGSFMIQGMLYPKLDGTKRSMLMKGITLIPGIGEVSESTSQVLIASAELTKNCFGIVGGIGLILLVAFPLLKIMIAGAGMKLLGSLLEILGEHNISELSSKIGTAQFYYVRLLLCEAGLLLTAFAVISLCTNHA